MHSAPHMHRAENDWALTVCLEGVASNGRHFRILRIVFILSCHKIIGIINKNPSFCPDFYLSVFLLAFSHFPPPKIIVCWTKQTMDNLEPGENSEEKSATSEDRRRKWNGCCKLQENVNTCWMTGSERAPTTRWRFYSRTPLKHVLWG